MVPLYVTEELGEAEHRGQPNEEKDDADRPVGGGEMQGSLVPYGAVVLTPTEQ
ncbi:hypothetical protein ES708_29772 [subsurface metagenome]